MSRYADIERSALTSTLRDAGPDAPTLDTGWTTRLLLAHLVRRERSLIELGARVKLPVITEFAERAMVGYAQSHTYEDLLATFASGAPRYSPFAFGPLSEAVNLLEYVIHHEDVRRAPAGWIPRVLPADFEHAVLTRLRSFAKLALRNAPVAAELRSPSGTRLFIGKGADRVIVTGRPVELAMVAFGRQRAAQVDYTGDSGAIAAFTAADLSA